MMNKFNINKINHTELCSKLSGEKFSLSAVLTEHLDFKQLFVHHEILPPGRRSASPHSHTTSEEMIIVLAGDPSVHFGNQVSVLKPGDFIGFHPSSSDLHFIENNSSAEVQLLVICSNPEHDNVNYKS